MTLRHQAGRLLTELRGDTPRASVARALGITRPAMVAIEDGRLSLDRLDRVGEVYGVRFELVAIDVSTEQVVGGPRALQELSDPMSAIEASG